jgi:hypothetical protein
VLTQNDVQEILTELVDVSITPMRPQNMPPTSLATINSNNLILNKNSLNNDANLNQTEVLTKLIIDLLEIGMEINLNYSCLFISSLFFIFNQS